MKINVNISTYQHSNTLDYNTYQEAKENARSDGSREFSMWNLLKATRPPFFNPGVEFLQSKLGQFSGGRKDWIFNMVGVFDSYDEPSIFAQLEADEEHIAKVKLGVINFGKHFDQKNVHLLEHLGLDVEAAAKIKLAPDATLQMARRFDFIQLQNIVEIAEVAVEFKLPGLSLAEVGQTMIVYTIGTPAENLGTLEALEQMERRFISQKLLIKPPHTWSIALYNYGKPENGGIWTYEEAISNLENSKATKANFAANTLVVN